MSRDVKSFRMKFKPKISFIFSEFSRNENYFIMQMANPGSCQSHSRVTLHVRRMNI